MPRHVSIQPGRLYPQPGYQVQVDKEGKWTARQEFLCHRSSAVALMPRPGTPHPEIPFLTISQVAASFTEGDLAEITCQYAGAEDSSGGNEKALAVYTMGLSLSEEPLLSHPRYQSVPQAEREAIQAILAGRDADDSGTPYRDIVVSSEGQEALGKISRGQTSYYSPRVVWRQSWVQSRSVQSGELNRIGSIDTPDGPAPALGGGRTWLLNGVTQTQEGASFRIEKEWLASDRGGWDPQIYSS